MNYSTSFLIKKGKNEINNHFNSVCEIYFYMIAIHIIFHIRYIIYIYKYIYIIFHNDNNL